MKLTDQLLVIGAVNKVVKINGDPWCTREEIQQLCGLNSKKVVSLLENLIDEGFLEQYKNGYRQSIWIDGHGKFVALMENSSEIMLVVQNFRIKFANKKMMELTRYSVKEIMAKNFYREFVHADDLYIISNRHLDRLKGKKVELSYSCRLMNKDGSVKRANISVFDGVWENKMAMVTLITDLVTIF